MTRRTVLLFAVLSVAAPALAQAKTKLAIKGLDPVALCIGKELEGAAEIVATHGRYHYRFKNQANRARFVADPERWGIQWGGGCARMGPLSGRGDPARYTVYESRIYIFASDACRAGFLKAPEKYAPPAPKPDLAWPSEADEKKGRALLEKAAEAHGGEALDKRKAIRMRQTGEQSNWKFDRRTTITASGTIKRRSIWTPPDPKQNGFDTSYVLDDDAAFMAEEAKVFDLTSAAERMDLRRFLHTEPVFFLWSRLSDKFGAVYKGKGRLRNLDVENVQVKYQDLTTTLHLSPEDGTILGLSWRGRANSGVTADIVEVFTKWQTIDGIRTPVARTMTVDGQERKAIVGPWDTVEFLTAPPRFARPSADRPAVERAVKDYVEALYQCKPELIRRSVHPALEKLGVWKKKGAKTYGVPTKMTFEQLVELAGRWNDKGQQGKDLKYDVQLFDVMDATATAKLTAKWGVDHMHLVKRNGRWLIVQILWQSHPK